MAPSEDPPSADTDFAQAFKDLAKGERTASAMETQLTSLERKLDDLLASVSDQTRNASASQSVVNMESEGEDKTKQ